MTMSRKWLLAALLAALTVCSAMPSSAFATFGINSTDLSLAAQGGGAATLAGSHPQAMTTSFAFNTIEQGGRLRPDGSPKDVEVTLPLGIAGIPKAVPQCPGADFATLNPEFKGSAQQPPSCSDDSAIGYATLKAAFKPENAESGERVELAAVPLYNLAPSPGSVAKFGFVFAKVPVTIEAKLSEEAPYRVVAVAGNIAQPLLIYSTSVTVWGDPAAAEHDPYRGRCLKEIEQDGSLVSRGSCPFSPGTSHSAFLTLPRACAGPLSTAFAANSWEAPGDWVFGSALTHDAAGSPTGFGDCGALGFDPSISIASTSSEAETPTGLGFDVEFGKDEGLTDPARRANSDLRTIVAKMPTGVTLNPSAAEGLAGCTTARYESERLTTPPGAGCPEASKIGTITATSPLVDEALSGPIFVAAPYDNPFGSFLGIYIVLRNQNLGVVVKQAGKVEADPASGRLTATFSDAPQLPISKIETHFRPGPRAPLATPAGCGTYTAEALQTSWAGRQAVTTASFQITAGSGAAACPPGTGSLAPAFSAGTQSSTAGSYSPLFVHLARRDGEANLTGLSMTLPEGLTGRLAGVQRCPDSAIAAAAAKSGREELGSPSCPSGSAIGHATVGAGIGPALTYVKGTVYLAGPYRGAPFSVAVVTPAVAGPYDLGDVVVREPLRVGIFDARVTVDGSEDPLPRLLKGIPVDLRDLQISIDRPGFTLNASGCEPRQIEGSLLGAGPAPTASGRVTGATSARYQASHCGALGFRPKVALRLKGATGRTGHPALRAVVTYPKKGSYSNIARAQVGLPHALFLDQGNLDKVCTQPELKADSCPRSSVYGHVKAWTPLLEKPLEGPVYLGVGFGHKLPDLVADLGGEVRILLHGRVDTTKHHGIRNTFEAVPDAPVSHFVLQMKGGRKYGLIENSEDLCARTQRASARFLAQNGRVAQLRPKIAVNCGRRHKRSK